MELEQSKQNMEPEQSKQKVAAQKLLNYTMYGLVVVIIGVMGLMAYEVPQMIRSIKQTRYAIQHLDSNAVSPEKNPFINNFSKCGEVVYEDLDGDGDYDSILKRKNFNGEFVNIPIKKGLEGKIYFMNLSKTAVDPLNIPKNPQDLELDYVDIDRDGKLESIIYLGLDNETSQKMKIERINEKYVLSNF